MRTRLASVAGFMLVVLVSALPVQAQVDPTTSFAGMPTPGWIMVCPAGDGSTLAASGTQIRVQVFDVTGLPMAGLPSAAFEVDGVPPGGIADGFNPPNVWDTQPGGFTNLGGGGYLLAGTFIAGGVAPQAMVKVMGVLIGGAPLPLRMNSPDITGDGVINLSDIGIFASLIGSGDWRADFNGDGLVNLTDIGLLVPHIGHTLPPGFVVDPVD
jgi:hypothetical protein